jgi:hypothetical protein
LKKRVSLVQEASQQTKALERLYNKPFWIWNIEEHKLEDVRTNGLCCFNHIIGLPQKNDVDRPMYDYEKIIFDAFRFQIGKNGVETPQPHLITQDDNDNNNSSSGSKHPWIKKATGLGISEFMLRFMAWLCLKDDKLSGSQMCIVTGSRIDLAIALIDRMKKLFSSSSNDLATTTFNTKETVIELNNVKIEAFPSHHLDAMRGLPNVSFILTRRSRFLSSRTTS